VVGDLLSSAHVEVPLVSYVRLLNEAMPYLAMTQVTRSWRWIKVALRKIH
jgi:hypothetical protein